MSRIVLYFFSRSVSDKFQTGGPYRKILTVSFPLYSKFYFYVNSNSTLTAGCVTDIYTDIFGTTDVQVV